MSSQRGPNYAGQNQEDGRQGQAETHADRLSKLVRLRVLLHCWAGCAFEDVMRALRDRESAQLAEDARAVRLEG